MSLKRNSFQIQEQKWVESEKMEKAILGKC